MGGSTSKEAKRIYGREQYKHWHAEHVLSAWQRAKALRAPSPTGRFAGPHAIRLNRIEFLSVFTELSHVHEDKFLALPLEMFEHLHPDEAGRVDCLEVLLPALVCCQAKSSAERARVLFEIYDLDGDAQIDELEMDWFIHVLTRVMYHNDLLDQFLTPNVVKRLGAKVFADADTNKNGWISADEFVRWIETVALSRRLLAMINAAVDAEHEAALERQRFERKRRVAERQQRRSSAPADRQGGSSEDQGASVAEAAPGEEGPARPTSGPASTGSSRRLKRRTSIGNLEDKLTAFKADDSMKKTLLKGHRPRSNSQTRTGAVSAQTAIYGRTSLGDAALAGVVANRVRENYINQAALSRVRLRCLFDKNEIRQLRNMFLRYCDKQELVLDRNAFHRLMLRVYSKLRMPDAELALDCIFRAFDVNQSGTLTFKEYAEHLSTLTRGAVEDKTDLLFEIFDIDQDRFIRTQELVKLLNFGTTGKAFVEASKLSERVLELIDSDMNGVVSREEFVAALSRHSILYDCFIQALLPGVEAHPDPVYRDTRPRASRFDFRTLSELYRRCQKLESSGTVGMNLSRFRVFMQEEFGCLPQMLPVVNRVFRLLDADGSGFLEWKEVFFGLERAMGVSGEDGEMARSNFYFDVYDIDGSGTIDGEEIRSMLMASGAGADVDLESVDRMLFEFDEDNDGSVSREEFAAAAKRDPNLIECFGRMFGVDHSARVVDSNGAPSVKRNRKHIKRLMRSLARGAGRMVGNAAARKRRRGGKAYVPRAVGSGQDTTVLQAVEGRADRHSEGWRELRRHSLAVVSGVVMELREQSVMVQELKNQADIVVDPLTRQPGRRRRKSAAGIVTPHRNVEADALEAAGALEKVARRKSIVAEKEQIDWAEAAAAAGENRVHLEGPTTNETAYKTEVSDMLQTAADQGQLAHLVSNDAAIVAAASIAATELSRATTREITSNVSDLKRDVRHATYKVNSVVDPTGLGRSAAAARRKRQEEVRSYPKAARLEHALDLSVDVSLYDDMAAGRAAPRRDPLAEGYVECRVEDEGLDPDEQDAARRKRAKRRAKRSKVARRRSRRGSIVTGKARPGSAARPQSRSGQRSRSGARRRGSRASAARRRSSSAASETRAAEASTGADDDGGGGGGGGDAQADLSLPLGIASEKSHLYYWDSDDDQELAPPETERMSVVSGVSAYRHRVAKRVPSAGARATLERRRARAKAAGVPLAETSRGPAPLSVCDLEDTSVLEPADPSLQAVEPSPGADFPGRLYVMPKERQPGMSPVELHRLAARELDREAARGQQRPRRNRMVPVVIPPRQDSLRFGDPTLPGYSRLSASLDKDLSQWKSLEQQSLNRDIERAAFTWNAFGNRVPPILKGPAPRPLKPRSMHLKQRVRPSPPGSPVQGARTSGIASPGSASRGGGPWPEASLSHSMMLSVSHSLGSVREGDAQESYFGDERLFLGPGSPQTSPMARSPYGAAAYGGRGPPRPGLRRGDPSQASAPSLLVGGASMNVRTIDEELGLTDKLISRYRRSRRYGYNADVKRDAHITSRINSRGSSIASSDYAGPPF